MTTLPGSISLLLRQGSPVFFRDEDTPWVVIYAQTTPDQADDIYHALVAPGDTPCIGLWVEQGDLALNLSDLTGQFHAALWLLSRLTGRESTELVRWGADQCEQDHPCFWLEGAEGGWNFCAVGDEGSSRCIHVPELADIDPADTIEALRLAVLHMEKA